MHDFAVGRCHLEICLGALTHRDTHTLHHTYMSVLKPSPLFIKHHPPTHPVTLSPPRLPPPSPLPPQPSPPPPPPPPHRHHHPPIHHHHSSPLIIITHPHFTPRQPHALAVRSTVCRGTSASSDTMPPTRSAQGPRAVQLASDCLRTRSTLLYVEHPPPPPHQLQKPYKRRRSRWLWVIDRSCTILYSLQYVQVTMKTVSRIIVCITRLPLMCS
jgi:hypothetical protein